MRPTYKGIERTAIGVVTKDTEHAFVHANLCFRRRIPWYVTPCQPNFFGDFGI
jgi:hypothetical protein